MFTRVRMRDDLADYLDGSKLWGDDFDPAQIAAWFEDERDAYIQLGHAGTNDDYEYHALNRRHGFRWLPARTLERVLGLGSADGCELQPILSRARHITIVEASQELRADAIDGVPVEHVAPDPSGVLPFADGSFDLATCFGVLHHIPNVSRVIGELHRCLRPGGHALVREPIVSMGDWRYPRRGLTKRERGIPLERFHEAIARAGFTIRRATPCGFPVVTHAAQALGVRAPFSHTGIVALDEIASRAFVWNLRYHPRTFFQRFRPTSMFFVLAK